MGAAPALSEESGSGCSYQNYRRHKMEIAEFRTRLNELQAQIKDLQFERREDASEFVMCECGEQMTSMNECVECRIKRRKRNEKR